MKKAFLACFFFVFSSFCFSDEASEYFDGAFKINQDPVVLDDFEIVTIKERNRISSKTERELERFFSSPEFRVMNLKVNWWDRGTPRFDEREYGRYSYDQGRESALPAKLAEKVYGGRVDVGSAKVYLEKVRLPSLRLSGDMRLSFSWRRGPAVALKMPWPMR